MRVFSTDGHLKLYPSRSRRIKVLSSASDAWNRKNLVYVTNAFNLTGFIYTYFNLSCTLPMLGSHFFIFFILYQEKKLDT